jgi:hypothetical protein
MAKLQIIYDVSDDIEAIIKKVEDHVNNLNADESAIFDLLQKTFQSAFDEGRRFQKQINTQSTVKDSILHKADI